ncbi:hypothetical protein C5167_041964, partial [Papaver somniferum]
MFLALFSDVVSNPKRNENFHLLYDTKVVSDSTQSRMKKPRVSHTSTHLKVALSGTQIPPIKDNDTIGLDVESNKIADFIKFDIVNFVMGIGGRNRENHKGSFDTLQIQDYTGHKLPTRLINVFTIDKGRRLKAMMTLPKEGYQVNHHRIGKVVSRNTRSRYRL